MSRSYPLTPVHRYCPDCDGIGRVLWALCATCDGIGRVFLEGGPSFGCQFVLSQAKPGQIVVIGNGDRGRVIRHCKRGPTTEVALIDPMFDEEDKETTTYPSVTGVASMSASSWLQDSSGNAKARRDHLDPLQGRKLL